LTVLALTTSAEAQDSDPTAAAILMVQDMELTERLGVALYGRFLEEGPYAEVRTLTGNADLAQTIRELAATHDVVDCFLSIHTTGRDPESWARALDGAGSKLRLVYSTACYGKEQEREAWERTGARTVVTHVGLNNPVVALPYFLSRWLEGEAVGPTVAEGFRETGAVVRYAVSLPGLSQIATASAETFGVSGDMVAGSQPVISGDAGLRITDGLPSANPGLPRELRYRREAGGPLGLILRALAGRFSVSGGEVRELLARLQLGALAPELETQLDKIESVSVEWLRTSNRRSVGNRSRPLHVRRRRRAEIVFHLRDGFRVDLQRGLRLTTSRRVSLRPGTFDPSKRVLAIHPRGVWLTLAALRMHLTHLRIQPARDQGYELRAHAGLWGVIPFWKTLALGGSAPEPDPGIGPILSTGSPEPQPRGFRIRTGLVDATTAAESLAPRP
jgi:hypothetical protein